MVATVTEICKEAPQLISRHYTERGVADTVTWETRESKITEPDGTVIFHATNVEVPAYFSQLATDILASKYFRKAGLYGDPKKGETSFSRVAYRVAHTIRVAGEERGYFTSNDEANAFEDELTYMLIHQIGAFNSPVFFNCFRGDQELITKEYGAVSFWAVAGEAVTVLTRAGWKPATIRAFGQQKLCRFTFAPLLPGTGGGWHRSKSNLRVSVVATPNHRWPLLRGGDTTTLGLKDQIPSMVSAEEESPDYRIGKQHGIVFGDGSLEYVHKDGVVRRFRVRLCGAKTKLASDFDNCRFPPCFAGDGLATLISSRDLKDFPATSESVGYLQGFLAGWLATDGSDSPTGIELYSSRSDALPWLKGNAARAGWLLTGFRERSTEGDGYDATTETRFTFALTQKPRGWEVVQVEELEDEELVYCAVVPEVHEFTLASGLLTGNCGLYHEYGIKGGSGLFAYNEQYNPNLNGQNEHPEIMEMQVAYEHPQSSACFIQSVQDDLMSIFDLVKNEARLFKYGSGTGTCFDSLRGAGESLSGGGTSSGLMSWLKVLDAAAGSIKSGGVTRRAATMRVLSVDHPDIESFIDWKVTEERKAQALIAQGYPSDFNGEAYQTVSGQNSNNSVRVPDSFMEAVQVDCSWSTTARTTGAVWKTYKARDLWNKVAEAAWQCADPGVQFDTTINDWHTCPNSGRITASNPCSEYMFLSDSACNLASLNLLKFLNEDGSFDVESYRHAIEVFITAQEILVDFSSYPTERIAKNSHDYRPLGLGYANLGSLLMVSGLPYDSDKGRALAGALTSILTGHAYKTSAEVAAKRGAFAGYAKNRDAMLRVIGKHSAAVSGIESHGPVVDSLIRAARQDWDDAFRLGKAHGYRNAQVTVLAPTGTIGFLMDCDTTGVEPEFALVKYKKLAGGGQMKIVNQSVVRALRRLGYSDLQVQWAMDHIEKNDSLEGMVKNGMHAEHLAVFDCASGARSISPMGHLRMMAAVQPFVSGAISKCLVGSTIVPTNSGLRRLGSFYGGNQADSFVDMNLRVSSRQGEEQASAFYYNGVQPTVRVTLGDGRIEQGTPVHRLLVATPDGLDWKRLVDLEPGDWVASKLGSNMWGQDEEIRFEPSALYGSQHKDTKFPKGMSPRLGTFLGMLTADGHVVRSNYTIGLTKNDPSTRELFGVLTTELFGLAATPVTDERNGVQGMAIHSKAVVEFLDAVGFTKDFIPDCVLSASRETVLGYMNGLYLDGWISQSISISQERVGLTHDLQQIWTNLGVHTYFTSNEVEGKDYPVLHVSGGYRKAAVALLTFIEPHKKNAAAALSDGENREVFPFTALRNTLCQQLRDTHRAHEFRSILDPRTRYIRMNTAQTPELRKLLAAPAELFDYVYTQVTSVEEGGDHPVFDISVPGSHSYVANGVISHNTVNVPNSATVEDIGEIYFQAWKLGLKAVALYRSGCKSSQPLNTVKENTEAAADVIPRGEARKLPNLRQALIQKARVGGHTLFLHTGQYEDGSLGEIFIDLHKEGSSFQHLAHCFAMAVSIGLQHGVPLETFVDLFTFTRFEPSGLVEGHDSLKMCTSLIDYIFRDLAIRYLGREDLAHIKSSKLAPTDPEEASTESVSMPPASAELQSDSPPCPSCGNMMTRSGTCYVCCTCGSTSGCS